VNVEKNYNSAVPPADGKGEKVDLPTMYYFNRNLTRLFVNKFTYNNVLTHKKFLLNFAGCGDVVSVWLNDKQLLDNEIKKGTPFQLDVSAILESGINSISIITRPGNRLPMRDIFLEAMPISNIKRLFIVPSYRKKVPLA